MGSDDVSPSPPGLAERSPPRIRGHPDPGRSDLGTGIRTFQEALRRTHADQPGERLHPSAYADASGEGCRGMNRPVVGFVGMTHLGIVSATAVAAKGFKVLCYDPDSQLIASLAKGSLPIVEPGLPELLASNGSNQRFSNQIGQLSDCDIVYIAPD